MAAAPQLNAETHAAMIELYLECNQLSDCGMLTGRLQELSDKVWLQCPEDDDHPSSWERMMGAEP